MEKNVSDKIIKQRLNGWNPNSISKYFISNYDIHIYPGDIFTWLDAIIRMLEAISRISIAFNNKKTSNECKRLIKKIEKALKQEGIFYTSFKYGTFEGMLKTNDGREIPLKDFSGMVRKQLMRL